MFDHFVDHVSVIFWSHAFRAMFAPKILITKVKKKMMASTALAQSCKSRCGGQGSQIGGLDKEIHKKMSASKALPNSWTSGCGSQGSQIDCFDKEIDKTSVAFGVLAKSWLWLTLACSRLRWRIFMSFE